MGFLEIFVGCPGDIFRVLCRYLVDVLEILSWFNEDYRWGSWRYLMRVPGIFDGFLADIWWVSWKYLIGVLVIFDLCPEDI